MSGPRLKDARQETKWCASRLGSMPNFAEGFSSGSEGDAAAAHDTADNASTAPRGCKRKRSGWARARERLAWTRFSEASGRLRRVLRKAAEQKATDRQACGGGNRGKRKITFQSMIDMVFGNAARRFHDTAAIYGVCEKSVRNCFFFVASCYFAAQSAVLGTVVLRAREMQPEFCMVRLCWDETAEKLTMNSPGLNKASTWHVLVARMRLIIAFSLEEVYSYSIVLPALVVASSSAADIHGQLFHHPWNAPALADLPHQMFGNVEY